MSYNFWFSPQLYGSLIKIENRVWDLLYLCIFATFCPRYNLSNTPWKSTRFHLFHSLTNFAFSINWMIGQSAPCFSLSPLFPTILVQQNTLLWTTCYALPELMKNCVCIWDCFLGRHNQFFTPFLLLVYFIVIMSPTFLSIS